MVFIKIKLLKDVLIVMMD